MKRRSNGIELSNKIFKISGGIKRGGQKTRVFRHDCGTRGHTGKMLCCHVWGLIVGIHREQKLVRKSNRHSTHGHIIKEFVQLMGLVKTSERSDTLIFSQTRIKVSPSWGIRRHRTQINMYMIIRGKRKLNIGTIGTTADLSNEDGT